jgi:hypothetical protein
MFALVAGLLAVVLAVFFVGAARAPTAHASSTPTVFTDPAADVTGAPDITSIAISDTKGVVTVTVTATGLVPGTWVDVPFDTDQNPSTGDTTEFKDGTEYALEVDNFVGTGIESWFGKWDGSEWVELTATPSMTFLAGADTYMFTFASADFGGTTAFDFYGYSGADGTDAGDVIPDSGPLLTYALTPVTPPPVTPPPVTPPVTQPTGTVEPRPITELPNGSMYLFADGEYHQISPTQVSTFGLSTQAIYYVGELYSTVGAPATDEQVQAMEAAYVKALSDLGVEASVPPVKVPTPPAPTATTTGPTVVEAPVIHPSLTVPAKASAGRVFTVSFPVTSSVTGARLSSATMISNPSVRGTIIKHFEQFKNGDATVHFTIPATAKGKTLKVRLTIVLGGQSTTRLETFMIR